MEEWRFLVVQIAGIGDLILATPALDALRERFPKCTLDVVTSPPAVSILQGHKSVDSVCSFDINRFRNFPTSLTLRNLIQLVQEIKPFRAKNYNALISLNKIASKRGSLTLGLFFLGLNIPLWIGRNTDGLAPYFDRDYKYNSLDPVAEAIHRLRTVALLGADPSPRPASLHITQEELGEAKRMLEADKIWIGIHPGSNRPARCLPVEKFAELAARLVKRGFGVVIFGGAAETGLAQVIIKKAGDTVLNLVGKTSLRMSAALMTCLKVFICNNSGPMHLAAAMGTPLVAIFDPIHRIRFAPWAPDGMAQIIFKDMPCQASDEGPCPQNPCCLQFIEVDEIEQAVMEMLAR